MNRETLLYLVGVTGATIGVLGLASVVYAPGAIAAIGMSLGLGIVAHELVHFVVAMSLAENVRFRWAGQPEVHYSTPSVPVARLVNLAPAAIGLTLLLLLLVFTSLPPAPPVAVLYAFAIGLVGYSPEDWSIQAATADPLR